MLRDGRHAAVVDPGDAAPVLAYLDAQGLALSAVIATHHHNDHVGGIPRLLARYDVPVYGPAGEAIPGRTHALREGDAITVPALGVDLTTLDIPGHTAGHIALVCAGDPMVFCGDTLFAAGCGRIFEGTPAQMWSSLSKLAALPAPTRVYCGHEYTVANLRFALAVEPDNAALHAAMARASAQRGRSEPTLPSTIGDERATNPFLRADVPAVRAAAEGRARRTLPDPVDSFAVLREWKNEFKG